MFKFTPAKINSLILSFLFLAILMVVTPSQAQFLYSRGAVVSGYADEQYLIASSETNMWEVGEILPIISQNSKIGVFAFVEVQNVKTIKYGHYELRLKLLRQSRKYLIQKGDIIKKLDMTSYNEEFIGTTDLIVKKSELNISSKYRPLVYQGISIGETAQTLYKNEFLINYLGNVFYGATDWLTLGTFAPGNLIDRPNANFKARFWDSDATTLSAGLSYVDLKKEDEATLNLNFYWDSTSSDSLISHTFLSLGLIKWDGAADAAAIKALGSSSFQSGYEVIRSDWDRVLIGPNYNFEKKALGGFLSYIWIYDRFHAQVSINATDITKSRLDPRDGYYGFFDFYWRF
ncbi:hypothetical protein CIK05_06810 [Bdellovibrio sp. qaytius]|nr:hypothetical protein CIK05_06810 [Bdellovibrio sp. qaytius]